MTGIVEIVEYLVVCYLVIQCARLYFADADLSLLWYEKMGKRADCLAGEVVWITGASSGIGENLAYDLSKAGCKLVLSARRQDELERVKKQCLSQGNMKDDDVMVLPFDVVAFDVHQEMVSKVLKHFHKIDVLVNNAGRTQRAMVIDTDFAVDRDLMALDYFGSISLTKAVLPHMVQRKKGHFVVMSSVCGKYGSPFSASYSGSKFALQGWFDALRVEECMNNIHVTLVCPGPVLSNIRFAAFAAKSGEIWGKGEDESDMMSAQRCTELMVVALVNKLDEVWISKGAVLWITYSSQYAPTLTRIFSKRMGVKAIMKVREPKWKSG